jgi:hypothetical protein
VLPKVGFENSLAKKKLLTWVNPCNLIWHSSTMIKLIIHEKKEFKSKCDSPNNNETFQLLECECEYPCLNGR